jgi:2-C-methyl-D-erythritol 4-phosphate cytidylyltransferase
MKKIALLVAGGKGERMRHDVPKQFMELGGKPVLMLSIEKFRHVCDEIVLVLPEANVNYWKKLCEIYHFNIPHHIVVGGTTRIHSVFNGLKEIPADSVVAIHDGVRPLIDEHTISNAFIVAENLGNAVTSVKLKDSIREVSDGKSKAHVRENFVLIQTPQTFRTATIKQAYEKLLAGEQDLSQFTDDASVAEFSGEVINLIEGNYRNIKLTTPEDMRVAEVLMHSS